MPPEQNQRSGRKRGQMTWRTLAVLLVLLVVPVTALYRLSAFSGVAWVLGGWAVLSALTYGAYASDKRKAEAGEWRTPENTLHLLEFAGGWPAAFVAQRKLRHKISKGSYQFFFWTIILVHQAAATDYLLDWKFTRLALAPFRGGAVEEKPAKVPAARAPAIYPPETASKIPESVRRAKTPAKENKKAKERPSR